ncbi:hypothetical protein A4R26_15495 [Niastella populi]|uniref:Uncharacterized protein n=1 Tax=Niastella populi TaxID=550983 RepID=A0A1V9G386_9BACT|nr:hypothetical protein A4R26_15495 [Niastella populi]
MVTGEGYRLPDASCRTQIYGSLSKGRRYALQALQPETGFRARVAANWAPYKSKPVACSGITGNG